MQAGRSVHSVDRVPTFTNVPSSSAIHRDKLARALEEWRQAGLIRAEEVEPILRYEQAKTGSQGRIPLAAEAVGYVGSALVITAIALLIGQRWDGLAVGLRIAVFAVPAFGAAAFGWWIGAKPDPAFVRVGSAMWVLSVGAFAGAIAVVFVDAIYLGDPPAHGGLLFVAGIVAVWAGGEYALRRLPLQQLAFFAASLVTVLGGVDALGAGRDRAFSTIVWGLAVWGFGTVWTMLGVRDRFAPSEVARLIGPATLLIGAQVVRADAQANVAGVFGLWLGLGSALLLIAVGVWRADLLVLLMGAAGLFQWAPQLAIFYLADAIGTEATLLVVGLLMLGAAYAFARLYRRVRSEAPTMSPMTST